MIAVLFLSVSPVALAQQYPYRSIIDFDVKCQSAPSVTALTVRDVSFDGRAGEEAIFEAEIAGTTWYHLRAKDCWVYGPSTVAANPDDALPSWLAMLDRHLALNDVRFERYVQLDNFLSDPDRRDIQSQRSLATSDLLRFKMLELLEQAIASPEGDDEAIEPSPFKKAWMLSHTKIVGHSEPGGSWYVRGEPYWDIYERNRNADWADDLAWIAAQHTPPTDDCMSDCVLEAHIIEGPLQYWSRLPRGRHVAEAIRAAAKMAEYSAGLACYDHVGAAAAGQSDQSPVSKALVRKIRQSLVDVVDSGKVDILNSLDEAERKCAN